MKRTFILVLFVLPLLSHAQEVGLAENYKTKRQKRLERFKPHKAGDLITHAGFSGAGRAYGLLYNVGAEYMLNEKIGIRASFSSNNLFSSLRYLGYQRYTVDFMYHFIQKKRWDIYAFVGFGVERYRYGLYQANEIFSNTRPVLNAGVGARYKVTPNFGVQLEVGRQSGIGIYKKFSLRR